MPPRPSSAKPAQTSSSKSTTRRPGKAPQSIYSEDDILSAGKACSEGGLSIAEAAEKFHVPASTLGDRMRGKGPQSDAHAKLQILTPEREAVIVQYLQARGWRNEPVDLVELRSLAQKLRADPTIPVGKNWYYAFLSRHPDLKRRWAKKGEAKRASGLNRSNTESFFAQLAIAREGVDPDCIWNCDEKGIVENGGTSRRRVLVGSDQTDPKVTRNESRKMVTVIECVSAVGGVIVPLIIHEGAEKDGEWIRSNPCGAHLAASPNGWTDTEVAREWLAKVFGPETEAVANGRKRLLILDGHISHCHPEFVVYAVLHNIVLLLLPPHTTHRLQPLDVGVFGPLARAWSNVVKELAKEGRIIRKSNLIFAYDKARRSALTEVNIRSAFKKCGIEPFDPSKITEEHMAPAEKTTFTASLPIPPTLAPFMEVTEDTPNPDPIPIDPLVILDDTSEPLRHPAPTPIVPLRDTTNQPREPLTYGPTIRQIDRPILPSKYTSKEELLNMVAVLHAQLDRGEKALEASYGREVAGNHENGRIRQQIHGSKGGRPKVTHLKTGARILTNPDSVTQLCAADRRKALGPVIKDLKVLEKHRNKVLVGIAKEAEGKRVQREKAEIDALAVPMKALEKEKNAAIAKLLSAEKMLEAAQCRLEDATTPSTKKRATESCKLHQNKVTKLEEDIESLDERYLIAEFLYNERCQEKQDRLDAIAAVDAEEKKEKDRLDAEAGEKQMLVEISAARRAQLPKRAKDPMELWKERRGEMELVNSQIPETQQDMFLPQYALRPAPGTQRRPDDAPTQPDQEIEILYGPFPLPVNDFVDPYGLPDPAEVLGRHLYDGEGQL